MQIYIYVCIYYPQYLIQAGLVEGPPFFQLLAALFIPMFAKFIGISLCFKFQLYLGEMYDVHTF